VREEIMAVVAHDLRTPLSTVVMLADRLGREGSLEPAQVAGSLERCAARMQRLVEDLLLLTRLEAGHLSVRAAEDDLAACLRDVVDMVRAQADRKRVNLVVDTPDGEVRAVFDRDRIEQALGNLLTNAIKFTPSGGEVRAALVCRDRDCTVCVSDTGAGIQPEHAEEIFRAFWQAPQAAHGGVGLGLAIAKGIAEAHGGSLSVDPPAGSGATFRFVLPFAGAPSDRVSLRPGSA
jgi:signal transduction histidine kinase